VTLLSGPAHAGSLTPRSCKTVISGDDVRRLDVCHRGWVGDNALYTRGVAEMHTYKWTGSGWADSTSQTITVNFAYNNRNGTEVAVWGQDQTQKCRVNGPHRDCRLLGPQHLQSRVLQSTAVRPEL
jgi:hypothetical protein